MTRAQGAATEGVGWLRRRARSAWLVAAAAVLAAGAVVAERWESPWWWFPLVLGVLLAVGGVVLPALQGRATTQDTRAGVVHRAARSADDRGRLRRVRDVSDLELGVHRSRVAPPYVTRDREGEVRAALAAGEPVLVLGHSMAGKTRMAAHVVQVDHPDRPVLVPSVPDGLATLAAEGAVPRGAVVWLDDLERYLVGDGLRVEWLDRMRREGNLVVATMRAQEHARFQPSRDLRPPQREVLERFTEVWLTSDPAEQERVAAQMPDRETREGVQRYGLAEYLGGGHVAVQRLRAGEATHPLGAAMVRAAADWRRAGLDVVPATSLAALAPTYLAARHRPDPGEDEAAALAWAVELVDGYLRLLEPTGDGYRAFDYVVDHLAATGPAVPDTTWHEVVASTPPELATVVGYRADVAGAVEHAATAWSRAAERGDGLAAFNLGTVRQRQGELVAAAAAFQVAADSGHPDVAPMAAVNLGILRVGDGDLDGAAAVLAEAVESGHPEATPRALVNLGVVRSLQGDLDAAAAAFQAVPDDHPDEAAAAAVNLGHLRREQGDPAAAAAAFERAVDNGHVDHAPAAAVHLGFVRRELGDLAGAVAAFQRAIDSGHAEMAPTAAVNLAVLHTAQHDLAAAAAAFQVAVDSGHPDHARVGVYGLEALRELPGGDAAAAPRGGPA